MINISNFRQKEVKKLESLLSVKTDNLPDLNLGECTAVLSHLVECGVLRAKCARMHALNGKLSETADYVKDTLIPISLSEHYFKAGFMAKCFKRILYTVFVPRGSLDKNMTCLTKF